MVARFDASVSLMVARWREALPILDMRLGGILGLQLAREGASATALLWWERALR